MNDGGCHAQAACNNSDGSFTCTCGPGYIGDGFNCTGDQNVLHALYFSGFTCVLFRCSFGHYLCYLGTPLGSCCRVVSICVKSNSNFCLTYSFVNRWLKIQQLKCSGILLYVTLSVDFLAYPRNNCTYYEK